MRGRYVIAALLALLLAAGCTGAGAKQAPAVEWSRSPSEVVFQVFTRGGFVPPFEFEAQVPELTVFGDGRVLFLRRGEQDGSQRLLQAHIPTEKELGAALAKAEAAMAGMKPEYTAVSVTDASTTSFHLATAKGKRRVSVYAFQLEPGQHQQEPAVMEQLREIRHAFLQAAKDVPVTYLPEELTLIVSPGDPQFMPGPRDWPEDLPSLPVPTADQPMGFARQVLRGADARKVAEQIPYRPGWLYRSGGKFYLVAAKPAIPVGSP